MTDEPSDLSSASEELLERISDDCFARLEQVGGDLAALDEVRRAVVVVYSAQGMIDNGGLRYLFENDWPNQPPYSIFADAYDAIGAESEARAIRKATAAFPFDEPERKRRARDEFLASDESAGLDALENECTSDVWSLLAAYVERHRSALEPDAGE